MWECATERILYSFKVKKWKLNWNVNRNHVNIDLWVILHLIAMAGTETASDGSGSGILLTFLHV